jgi:hypothetical protein
MARLPQTTEAENEDGTYSTVDIHKDAKCSICGSEYPSAMWSGCEDIFVCTQCAKNILPRLIADAFMAGHVNYDVFLRYVNEAKTAFYQAAHCAAMFDKR